MTPARRVLVALAAVALLAGAAGGGFLFGQRRGRADGFAIGVRYGQREAARVPPMPVSDRGHPADALLAVPAVADLPVEPHERQGFAALLNAAVSPCAVPARRGASLATSLVDPAAGCAGVGAQARLALGAYRTFVAPTPDDANARDEALAFLRLERRVPFPAGDAPAVVRGTAAAAVTLSVFTDYQCPYCARGEAVLDAFLAERGADVRVVTRHLPLERIHPAARPAARAVEAAARQGQAGAMHAALFAAGGKALGAAAEETPPFAALARGAGLDSARYAADVADPALDARIDADLALAEAVGAGGTPAFFFDGREYDGPRSAAGFGRALDRALGERELHVSWDLLPPPPSAAPPAP